MILAYGRFDLFKLFAGVPVAIVMRGGIMVCFACPGIAFG